MPPQTDLTTPPSKPVAALLAASFLLIALALGGAWVSSFVMMVPSAVPAEMAVEAEHPKNSLSSNAHSGLHLSSSAPQWKDLSAEQRSILNPLRERWETMGSLAKRRWLVLADRYPSMPENERTKLVSRMQTWASLSAQQRNQARLNFKNAKRLSVTDLQSKWGEYQALSEAEKQRLAEQAKKAKSTPRISKRRPTRTPNEQIKAPQAKPNVTPLSLDTDQAEAVPVFTPKVKPDVYLLPLESSSTSDILSGAVITPFHPPSTSSLPVIVPNAEPVIDIPPLDDWSKINAQPQPRTIQEQLSPTDIPLNPH